MKNNFKYDAVFYDFDGTLADSVPIILESFKGAYLDVFGKCDRTDESFKSYIGLPLMECFEMHDKDTQQKLYDAYLKINHKLLEEDKVKLYPGVYEGLKSLHEKGIIQGIVTSKKYDAFIITARLTGIIDFFDVVICKEDTRYHKPNPDPIQAAAEKAGLTDFGRILYVGDALPDVCCSKNAGTDFIFVNWSEMPKADILFMKPEYCIDQLSEISCIIDNNEL